MGGGGGSCSNLVGVNARGTKKARARDWREKRRRQPILKREVYHGQQRKSTVESVNSRHFKSDVFA